MLGEGEPLRGAVSVAPACVRVGAPIVRVAAATEALCVDETRGDALGLPLPLALREGCAEAEVETDAADDADTEGDGAGVAETRGEELRVGAPALAVASAEAVAALAEGGAVGDRDAPAASDSETAAEGEPCGEAVPDDDPPATVLPLLLAGAETEGAVAEALAVPAPLAVAVAAADAESVEAPEGLHSRDPAEEKERE